MLKKIWIDLDDSRKNKVSDYMDQLPYIRTLEKIIDNEKKVKK